jgi:hypothetical protein
MDDHAQEIFTLIIFLILAAATIMAGEREKPPQQW